MMGGWLVDHGSWRPFFLINPSSRYRRFYRLAASARERRSDAKKGLDARGAALAFFGLGLLVYGLITASEQSWRSPVVIGSLVLGAVLLSASSWPSGAVRHP